MVVAGMADSVEVGVMFVAVSESRRRRRILQRVCNWRATLFPAIDEWSEHE
jgi:hypothetical protein